MEITKARGQFRQRNDAHTNLILAKALAFVIWILLKQHIVFIVYGCRHMNLSTL